MRLGIRSKLFLVSLGLIAGTLLVADAVLTRSLDRLLTDRIQADLLVRDRLAEAQASAFQAPFDDLSAWNRLAHELERRAQARVTLIRKDGAVLGDSEMDPVHPARMENHANRPEVVEALSRGNGSHVRLSETVNRRFLYVAVPFQRAGSVEGVARLALPLDQVDEATRKLRAILAVGLIFALGIAALLSSAAVQWTSRGVRRLTGVATRMSRGDLSTRTRVSGHDEIATLGRALDQLAASLSTTIAELRKEGDLLGRILSGMQEGVLVLDEDDRVVLMNPSLREMLLLNADPTGKAILEAVRHAELKTILDQARTAEAFSNQPSEIDVGGIKPRRLLVHAAPLPESSGGLLAVFVDVTGLRRLETIRKDFVANVSHELRTPVTAIRSAAETLGSALEDRRAAKGFVEIIERNAERLAQLIEDLLDLSRIESREFTLRVESVDLTPFVEHVFSLHRERADRRNLRLVSELREDLPPVRADRRALEQAVGNLVDNAVKYCGESSTVRVRAETEAKMVCISVADTGPGIEPRHLSRIFERFYRVDAGRSRDLGGTGLGLSIVKHLVEAMGGTVAVESILGRGTTFFVRLPADRPADT